MVAALLLKEQFEQVTLLERRTEEDFLRTQGFTFPIVLSPCSIRIMEQIGIWDAICEERSEFFGVVIHGRVLGRELTFTSVREGVYSHWRNHVVAKLYEQVRAVGIAIHFESRVEAIDFQDNVCREARLGDLSFDLLLGADGSNSQTRRLLAHAHPHVPEDSFARIGLDHWYAYRVPSRGAMRERFAGGERHHASNVFLSNLPAYPTDRFRIVTTGMRQPEEEISILVRHDPEITPSRLKALNDSFFAPLVGSQEELDAAWRAGYAGRFDQVQAPTFHLGQALLIGDAAHGFESTGDLINLGLASAGYLREVLGRHADIPAALEEYDATAGDALRFYAGFSYRRSLDKINFEVFSIELAHRLGLTRRHPTLFGIYDEDFELVPYLRNYQRDIVKARSLVIGLAAGLAAGLASLALLLGRRRTSG
jgi:2-polyprenyl-6-methoxyphenol hydroxylase-like FAD-dependent oxidoreductase